MNLTFHTSIVREHEKFSKRGVTERIAPKRPSTVGLVCAPLLLLLLLLLQQRRSRRRRRRRRHAARRSLITITISRLNGRVFIQKPPRIEIDRACKIYKSKRVPVYICICDTQHRNTKLVWIGEVAMARVFISHPPFRDLHTSWYCNCCSLFDVCVCVLNNLPSCPAARVRWWIIVDCPSPVTKRLRCDDPRAL